MSVTEINGQQAFARLSGRDSFAVDYKRAVTELLKFETYDAVRASSSPEWYTLPEIPWEQFVACKNVVRIYSIRQGKACDSLTKEDPFVRACYPHLNDDEFMEHMVAACKPRQYAQVIGNLHTEVAGLIPGFLDDKTVESRRKTEPALYPKDFMLGCDLIKEDRTEIYEFKNNVNTMNSDSKKSVHSKLQAAAEKGFAAFLVRVCANAWK